jgi:hypothetical protein
VGGLNTGGPSSVYLAWPNRWCPGGVWICHGVRARHSLRGRDPIGGSAWIQHGAVAWHSLWGGGPSRVEEQLCRPTGWELGKLVVLLLDCGMEKPSTI